MKKIKTLIAFFLSVVLICSSSFNLWAKSGVSLSLNSSDIVAGETFSVTVSFSADSNMNAFYYEILYNTNDVEFVRSSAASVNSSIDGTIICIIDTNSSSVTETFTFRSKKAVQTEIKVVNALSANTIEYEYPSASVFVLIDRATIGDVNDDTVVDVSDLASLKLFLAGAGNEIHSEYSDINVDNEIDVSDLAVLKLYLAGAYSVFR